MVVTRVLVASLLSYLAIASIGGNAQPLPPDDTSPQLVFSVDVLLDESADPVPLGIRDGQTVAQAAEGFCHEHGLDEAMRTVLMPQLIGVLENGIAEAIGDARSVGGDGRSSLPNHTPEHDARSAAKRDTGGVGQVSDEPLFTLGISLDGTEERMLSYYTGQDPDDAAAAFCVENVNPSSHSEVFTRCSETLSSSIIERASAINFASNHDAQAAGQQQQQQRQERHGQADANRSEEEGGVVEEGDAVRSKPLLTVPLNINGLETALQMYEGSRPEGLASEFCRREEFAFEGQSLISCYSQVVELSERAIRIYNSRENGEQLGQAGAADPFTFKVPVTLAGILLHAEYRASETPHVSALRFCGQNLPAIESALGVNIVEEVVLPGGDDDAVGEAIPAGGGGGGGGERESLKEACAMVVEDAINAVLLGLRERVLEAEMAQANATESLYNDADGWPREQSVAAAAAAVEGGGGLDGIMASLEAVTDATA